METKGRAGAFSDPTQATLVLGSSFLEMVRDGEYICEIGRMVNLIEIAKNEEFLGTRYDRQASWGILRCENSAGLPL